MPTPNDKFMTVRLPAEEYRRLQDAAESDDRKLGPMARLLIRDALDAREHQRVVQPAGAGPQPLPRRVIKDAPQA